MSPDLTPTQTIAIGTPIATATLVFFLTALLTLAYAQEVRNSLLRIGILCHKQIPRTDFRNAPFPAHYVLPYQQPESTIWPCMASKLTTQTRTLHYRAMTTI